MKFFVFVSIVLAAMAANVLANGYGGHGHESGYHTEIKHVWQKHDGHYSGGHGYGDGHGYDQGYGHGKVLTGHSTRFFKMEHNKGYGGHGHGGYGKMY